MSGVSIVPILWQSGDSPATIVPSMLIEGVHIFWLVRSRWIACSSECRVCTALRRLKQSGEVLLGGILFVLALPSGVMVRMWCS